MPSTAKARISPNPPKRAAYMNSTPKKSPKDTQIVMHQLMLPEHANAWGKVHGGLIMKLVDEAGGICAMRHANRPCVTVAIDSMTFQSGVAVGSVLSCNAKISYVSNSAIEVTVCVHAEDPIKNRLTHTNTAYLVYVAIDDEGRPVKVPPLELVSEEDRYHFNAGMQRQADRLTRRNREEVPQPCG